MKTFTIKTLGCKVNQCDSQKIREGLLENGWREYPDASGSALCIVNTCCVTHQADRKSRYAIREAIRGGKKTRVVVTGCYAGYGRQALEKIDGLSAVFANEEKQKIVPWLMEHAPQAEGASAPRQEVFSFSHRPSLVEDGGADGISSDGASGAFGAGLPAGPMRPRGWAKNKTRGFLKIQDGCDNRCSYCVIPFVRGASRSRPPDDIVEEAHRLVDAGCKEAVLTGICLGAWGKDLAPRRGIADVIERLERLRGLERIRLSSIEASDVSDRLIEKMADSGKLCPHLHIPFQSGDDEVLRDMNKGARVAQYRDLLARAKNRIRNLAVTCDMIVGFPTETERHFLNTKEFLEGVVPLKTHIFSYSDRRGTMISQKGFKVPETTVRRRFDGLKGLADALSLDCRRRYIGEKAEVLFESGEDGRWTGYSRNYIKITAKSDIPLANAIKTVRIKAIEGECVKGEIVG